MLMLGSPLIVLFDVNGVFRIIIIKSVAKMLRDILQHYSPTRERKSVGHEDNITAFGNLICPGYAFVIVVLMSFNQRVLLIGRSGDLGFAKIFIASMIVKRKNTGKSTPCVQWPKNECFGRSSVWQLP